ncbi:MAG: TRAP transporter small permease subunit [Thiothrix sp.]|nr:TRAP transporter small permease subunit [Thiothrix sp.]
MMYFRFAQWLDRMTVWLCMAALTVLVSMVLIIVMLRYGFGVGFIQLQDAASYVFAALLIFSVPVTLARAGHVRVDIFAERLGAGYLRKLDTFGLFFMLIPVFGLLIWAWLPSLQYAWSIREASVETGGLPGLYLVKTTLPVAAGLTIIQGIAAVLALWQQRTPT